MKQFLIDGNIDWEELRKQKSFINEALKHPQFRDSKELDGILHLIDNIQDNAVESGIWTEEEIFGHYNETTGEYEETQE